jgi:hypothetical protein
MSVTITEEQIYFFSPPSMYFLNMIVNMLHVIALPCSFSFLLLQSNNSLLNRSALPPADCSIHKLVAAMGNASIHLKYQQMPKHKDTMQ